jgi:hypothetical protein
MKGKYRVYVLGEVPKDLRERISELHATAILRSQIKQSKDQKIRRAKLPSKPMARLRVRTIEF